jgi:hypothetical protein
MATIVLALVATSIGLFWQRDGGPLDFRLLSDSQGIKIPKPAATFNISPVDSTAKVIPERKAKIQIKIAKPIVSAEK